MAIFVNPLRPSESGGINEDFINNKLSNYVTKDAIEEANEDFINDKLSNYVTKDTIGDTNKFGLVSLYTNSAGANRSGLALSTDNDSGNPVNRLYVACRDGIKRTGSGEITIDAAVKTDIDALDDHKPIVPRTLGYGVKKTVGIGNINQPGLVQLRAAYNSNGVFTNLSGLNLDSSDQLFVNCLRDKGIIIDTDGNVAIAAATPSDIDAKTNSYKPIVPSNLEYAVRSIIGNSDSETTSDSRVAEMYNIINNNGITFTSSIDSTFHPLKIRDERIDIFKQDAIESQNISGTSAIKILPTSGEVKIPIVFKEEMKFLNDMKTKEIKIYSAANDMNNTSSNNLALSINCNGLLFRGNQQIIGELNDPDLIIYAPDDIRLQNGANGLIQIENFTDNGKDISKMRLNANKITILSSDTEIEGPLSSQSIHLDSYGTKLNGPTYVYEPSSNDTTFEGSELIDYYLSNNSLSNIFDNILQNNAQLIIDCFALESSGDINNNDNINLYILNKNTSTEHFKDKGYFIAYFPYDIVFKNNQNFNGEINFYDSNHYLIENWTYSNSNTISFQNNYRIFQNSIILFSIQQIENEDSCICKPIYITRLRKPFIDLEVYSERPQQIGTWVDGTPVWRVCIDQEFDEQFFADLEGAFQTGEDDALNDFISIDTTKFCKNMNNIVAITHAYLYIVPKSGSCIVNNLPLTISSNTPYNLTFNYPQGATGNGNIDNLQNTWYGVQGVLEFVTPANNIKLN